MNFLKKVPFLVFILFSYIVTRLANLRVIPIFTDEAIYTYWAQVALHDPANRFISMEDGKQPLFIWLAAVFSRFISDPLVAARLVSVFAGAGSVLGIYFLARELFNTKVAKIASLLYIFLPFTLLYDRLALFDSLLTMFCIWTVFLSIKIAKNPRLDFALLNGIVLGLGLITKSSANFFLYLLPFSLIFFDFKKPGKALRLTKWLGLSFMTFVISQIIYNALRVSPLFYMISRKNHEFIRTFSQVINDPFAHFEGNINSIIIWAWQYSGPLLTVLIAVMITGVIKREKRIILLSIYIIAPFLAKALFNQILYPRFSLFYFPFVIILIAYGLWSLPTFFSKLKGPLLWFVIAALLVYPLTSSLMLIINPKVANIASSDKLQYINGWSAGFGVPQIVNFLRPQLENQKVYVGTEGTFGLLPFALQIYFYGNPNIAVVGYWPVGNIPKQVFDTAKVQKTYFIFYQNQELPHADDLARLKLIAKYQQGSGNSFMSLYEVIPQ